MQIWSEFSWSYASNSIAVLYIVGPFVACLLIWAFYKCLGRETPVNIGFMTYFSFLWAFVGLLTFWNITLDLTGYYNLPAHKQAWARLAVVEKSSGNIVAHNLTVAKLRPWPFSRYRVVEHPSKLLFRITLQPITKNPKVVPLTINVAVKLRDDTDSKELKEYILSPEKQKLVETEFKKQVFDLLQHRLPQEEASRLNPFDYASVSHFHDFISKELDLKLGLHRVADIG